MCICVYMCIRVYVYMCVCVCTYTCIYIYIYIYIMGAAKGERTKVTFRSLKIVRSWLLSDFMLGAPFAVPLFRASDQRRSSRPAAASARLAGPQRPLWQEVQRELRGSQGIGVVSDKCFDRVLLSVLCVFKPSCWPMFNPPFLGTPLVTLKQTPWALAALRTQGFVASSGTARKTIEQLNQSNNQTRHKH